MTTANRTNPPTRRANNGGSLTLFEGRWIARVSDPHSDKRIKRVITRQPGESTRDHKRRAERTLAELLDTVTTTTPEQRNGTTVREWGDTKYLPSLDANGLKSATQDGYATLLATYVYPRLGDVELAQLTVAHVDTLDAELRRKGLSVVTRRAVRGVLHRLLRHARTKGYLAHVVTADADKIARVARRDLTDGTPDAADVRIALRAARTFEGGRWELAIALLALLGLRRGEVLGLGWDCVDLDAGTLRVTRSLVPLSGGRIVLEARPKTDASTATLPLDPAVVALFRAHRARQAEQRLAAGEVWEPSFADVNGDQVQLVFADEAGRALKPHRLNAALKRLGAATDLDGLHPHAFRHGVASVLFANNRPITEVQAYLRHANSGVTLSVYSHAAKTAKTEAGGVMSAAIGEW